MSKLDASANFNLQLMQIMEYEKAPFILFSKHIIFELEYVDLDNYITNKELDILLDLMKLIQKFKCQMSKFENGLMRILLPMRCQAGNRFAI